MTDTSSQDERTGQPDAQPATDDGPRTASAKPQPPAEPPPGLNPRQQASARDMIFSVLALVAIIGVVVLFTRGCEFSPGGPSIDQGAAPTVNARTELNRMAERVDFPIRQPELPAGWRANSARTTQLGTGAGAPVLAEIGWLTPDGAYLRLVQSEASTEELVDEVAGKAGAGAASEGTVRSGSVGSDDLLWDVYPGKDDQQTWVLKLPEVRVLISGSASGKEFGELADAVEAADDNVAEPSAGR